MSSISALGIKSFANPTNPEISQINEAPASNPKVTNVAEQHFGNAVEKNNLPCNKKLKKQLKEYNKADRIPSLNRQQARDFKMERSQV